MFSKINSRYQKNKMIAEQVILKYFQSHPDEEWHPYELSKKLNLDSITLSALWSLVEKDLLTCRWVDVKVVGKSTINKNLRRRRLYSLKK